MIEELKVHQRRPWQVRVRIIGAVALALFVLAGLFVVMGPRPTTAQSADSQSIELAPALRTQTSVQAPQASPQPQTAHLAGQYKIIGWNDLGMHCMNESFANLAVLPPFNNLWAQVIRQGPNPEIVTTGVTVEYSIDDNTYSVGKTDFWQYVQQLFGADLPPNVGLTGATLAGQMHSAGDQFTIEGVPLTPYRDSAPQPGPQNWYPYQLAKLIARDSVTGQVLAETTTVAPVSTEMRCDTCHSNGMQGGISTGNVETNILTLHDREESTNLMGSRPVLCASCHASNALGMPGNPDLPNLSRAMHSRHALGAAAASPFTAATQALIDSTGASTVPTTVTSEGTNDCYLCHPGQQTKCLRDVMYSKGLTCTTCHGDTATVADPTRRPWIDLPRCATCHAPQFAENTGKRYRDSVGHGGLYCEACHGSPHAILPSIEPNDNLQNIALQGHAGTLSDCTVCHATLPDGPGPHSKYVVTGVVEDSARNGIAGVTISDEAGHSTTTGGNSGGYVLEGLPAGTHTLTPSKSGYTFSPSSRSVTVPPNVTDANFAVIGRCATFGDMTAGQSPPSGVSSDQIKWIFAVACEGSPNIAGKLGDVHWWGGLLVQDYLGIAGQENGAIFYDVNTHQGGAEAFVLWGPILQRYWANASWGAPQSDRVQAIKSRYNSGTTGHLVRFPKLDVYYNDRTEATYIIRGATRDCFNASGGTSGLLGFPRSEDLSAASGCSRIEGWYQNFEGGIIHTFERQGTWQAWEVHGAIQATYNSLDGVGFGSSLGFPLSGENVTEVSPADTKGLYQFFECGRIYYDSPDTTGGDVGATFVLYNNISDHLPAGRSGVDDDRIGFPIEKQKGPNDCRVFFEFGYIDCLSGIQSYAGEADHPNPPGLSLPYAQTDDVKWTGGPHGYGAGPKTKFYLAGFGSGIDFASGEFEVYAMASGTVIEEVHNNCDSGFGLGCRIAIRNDAGGTVLIYSHLKPSSMQVERLNTATGKLEKYDIRKGMYIFARERIGTAGQSGLQDDIHLHVEFRDGTGRTCSSSYCYDPPTTDRGFGLSMDWHDLYVGDYLMFGYWLSSDTFKRFNYDGSAVKDTYFGTKNIVGHYTDPVFGWTEAEMTVHQSFKCEENEDCEKIDGEGLTEFAGHGCLGGACADARRLDGLLADGADDLLTSGRLVSDHNGIIVSFDPDKLTLASPDYGYPEQRSFIFLPLVMRGN